MSHPRSLRSDLDGAIERLRLGAERWVTTTPQDRARYLQRCIDALSAEGEAWVRAAAQAKKFDASSNLAGEEWLSGPATTLRGLRLFKDTLLRGPTRPFDGLRQRPNGQWIASVFPADPLDRLLYFSAESEVWIEPGQEPSRGSLYQRMQAGRFSPARVALVLGAGNVGSIGPLDLLHKLLIDDETVVLKMNPVNDYLGPIFERAFAPLIQADLLAIAYGGAEIGDYLCQHPGIHSIHLTGSDKTHDAIVWGPGEEGSTRKRSGTPRISKPISAELGCVTPILVCPGEWTDEELQYQADQVAAMVAHNASFNCNAGKLLVVADGWELKDAFLSRVRTALEVVPSRYAYYPGAATRYKAMLEHYPQARRLGPPPPEGHLPWTLIPEVPPSADEYALRTEAFCGILAVTSLPVTRAEEFLAAAADFANESVWGSLSCCLIIDGRTRRENEERLGQTVDDLHYGGIGINAWPGLLFYLGQPSWGAFPGNSAEDIGSGRGWVHNTLMFDHPQKSVLQTPFRIWPKPIWFPGHQSLRSLGRRLASFEASPSLLKIPGLGIDALRG